MYYLVNFNDLAMSVHTLFAFMIINNWPAMTDMMVNASGQKWPRVYFMVFYILVQWIVLNIVIAMMLDIFSCVSEELDQEFDKLGSVKRLMRVQERMGTRRFVELCRSVNRKILLEEIEKNDLLKKALVSEADTVSEITHTA